MKYFQIASDANIHFTTCHMCQFSWNSESYFTPQNYWKSGWTENGHETPPEGAYDYAVVAQIDHARGQHRHESYVLFFKI